MEEQGHLESAIYMVRNFITGDDEQTRIEDEDYLSELPSELSTACQYLCKEGDYDGAILIYVRWHLRQVIKRWYRWEEHMQGIRQAAETIYKELYLGFEGEEKKEIEAEKDGEIESWLNTLQAIIEPGWHP